MNQTQFQKVKELVDKANSILILTHDRPSADSMGSTLALFLALQSMGKKVTVACPDPMTVELSSFVGANKVVTEIRKKNFIISLDYIEGSIEKVSYNIEGNKFNLVIEPREGFDTFAEDKVHFTQAGVNSDLIFVVDTIQLSGLKKLYDQNKEIFTSTPIVNIDRHPNNTQYGQVSIIEAQSSSIAEMIYEIIVSLGVQMNQDIAANLLNAIYSATNNFTAQNTTAKAFEIAAVATNLNARRFKRAPQTVSEEIPVEENVITSPIEVDSGHGTQDSGEAPPDWLKPKIFKSSSLG